MTRGFGYSKRDGADCSTCAMYWPHCAKGNLCQYDENPVERGYRCNLYLAKQKQEKGDPKSDPELF